MINTTSPKKNMNWENIKKQCASLGTLLFFVISPIPPTSAILL